MAAIDVRPVDELGRDSQQRPREVGGSELPSGEALDQESIAVRTGHHCAQPILRRFGLETAVRPSLAFYNTGEEVDRRVTVVKRLSASRAG
jgi:selenocysteine lyase/cysteine desulfurase